jgi:hypothetical protein
MTMKTMAAAAAASLLAITGAGAAPGPRTGAQADAQAEAGLSALVSGAIREGGSFFTPKERAIIEAKCGYAPGEWDGIESSMIDSAFRCTNGRTVDDPEIRAVMRAAAPRIEARVHNVMNRPDVKAAIERVAAEAAARAMAELAARRGG